VLRVLDCGADRDAAFREIDPLALQAAVAAGHGARLLWVDSTAPDEAEVAALAAAFGWHPLVVEDLGDRDDRQKLEVYPGLILLVAYRPGVPTAGEPVFDRLYALGSERTIVTVHESCPDIVARAAAVAARRPDLERNGAMAAVAPLLDELVQAYDAVLGVVEGRVEEQEADALTATGDPVPALREASASRTAVSRLRRASVQLRELVGVVVRRELVDAEHSNELDLELRDIHDNVSRIHDDLDMLHDRMSALADTRLAMVAFRQNEITKKLSAYGALLLVPTIVTGWFGQNFHHLGALAWTDGPAFAIGVMVAVMAVLWTLLRRSEWL